MSDEMQRQWLGELTAFSRAGDAQGWATYRLAMGCPLDLRGMKISGLDLRGFNLSRGDFRGAVFENCDLRSADLTVAHVANAVFRRCKLEGAYVGSATIDQAAEIDPAGERALAIDGFPTPSKAYYGGNA